MKVNLSDVMNQLEKGEPVTPTRKRAQKKASKMKSGRKTRGEKGFA